MMGDLSRRETNCVATLVFIIPLNSIHDETLVGFSLMHSASVMGSACVVDARINVFHRSGAVVMLRGIEDFRLLTRQSLIQSETVWESTHSTQTIPAH